MVRYIITSACGLTLICVLWVIACRADEAYGAAPRNTKEYLDRLVRYYPDFILGYEGGDFILKNGIRFRISDARSDKTFDELLEKPDIDDMFYARYPVGAVPKQPGINKDAGREVFKHIF